jgi:hypothetical protein
MRINKLTKAVLLALMVSAALAVPPMVLVIYYGTVLGLVLSLTYLSIALAITLKWLDYLDSLHVKESINSRTLDNSKS